mgnify:CR=1 FL=1
MNTHLHVLIQDKKHTYLGYYIELCNIENQ